MGCRRGGGRGGLGAVPARGRVATPRVRVGLRDSLALQKMAPMAQTLRFRSSTCGTRAHAMSHSVFASSQPLIDLVGLGNFLPKPTNPLFESPRTEPRVEITSLRYGTPPVSPPARAHQSGRDLGPRYKYLHQSARW